MKTLIFSLFTFASVLFLNGQSLAIHDHIPDVKLDHMLFYHSKTASLKDFNNKYLIIDFWSTTCGSCIETLAKMENLKKKYDGKLQILLVTPQQETVVTKFLNRRQLATGQSNSIPICVNDTVLSKLFPHIYASRYVWIDDHGKVYAMDDLSEQITEQNVNHFIDGKQSQMIQVKEEDDNFDFNKSLATYQLRDSDLVYHSILTKYQPGLHYMATVCCDEKYGYKICIFNQDIRSIYQTAFDTGEDDGGRGLMGLPYFQTVFEVSDTNRYFASNNGIEHKEKEYCYELRVPYANSFKELKAMMQSDLERYFHLRACMEKRLITCLVLHSDDTMAVKSKNGNRVAEINEYSVDFQNTSLAPLFKMLRYWYMVKGKYPIINETGISGPVDMHFIADMSSPNSLNIALAPYKMHFNFEKRWVDMLIIQETPKSSNGINDIGNNKISLDGN